MNIISKRITLLHEGDPGAETRTRNPPGEVYRGAELHDSGTDLVTQADIAGIANGTLVKGGSPATLFIFDFRFISNAVNESRRFKKIIITLTIAAAGKKENAPNPTGDPEIMAICPNGKFTMNRSERKREVTFKPKAGLKAGVDFAGADAGVEWELKETKTDVHFTRINGLKRITRKPAMGKPNTAIWTLQENTHKGDGLPSFLRTCLLLRRTSDEPFTAFLHVESTVDIETKLKRMVGLETFDAIDPFTIIQDAEREEDLGGDDLDLDNLGGINLQELSGVIAATVVG